MLVLGEMLIFTPSTLVLTSLSSEVCCVYYGYKTYVSCEGVASGVFKCGYLGDNIVDSTYNRYVFIEVSIEEYCVCGV